MDFKEKLAEVSALVLQKVALQLEIGIAHAIHVYTDTWNWI